MSGFFPSSLHQGTHRTKKLERLRPVHLARALDPSDREVRWLSHGACREQSWAHDPRVRPDLPSGTATFLFTDVEGSTKLLHELAEEGCADTLAEHWRVFREACAAEGGIEVDTQGTPSSSRSRPRWECAPRDLT